ncbi:MAG: hypothetical protein JW384_00823 [Nitrosomonadaceae bacterium]|nr:hypothetical protein [Nitrosomonadaceae bacterium]
MLATFHQLLYAEQCTVFADRTPSFFLLDVAVSMTDRTPRLLGRPTKNVFATYAFYSHLSFIRHLFPQRYW